MRELSDLLSTQTRTTKPKLQKNKLCKLMLNDRIRALEAQAQLEKTRDLDGSDVCYVLERSVITAALPPVTTEQPFLGPQVIITLYESIVSSYKTFVAELGLIYEFRWMKSAMISFVSLFLQIWQNFGHIFPIFFTELNSWITMNSDMIS